MVDTLARVTDATEVIKALGGSNYSYNNYIAHQRKIAPHHVLYVIARSVFPDKPGCAQFIYLVPQLKAEDIRDVKRKGGNIEAYLRYLDHKGKPSVSEEDSRHMLDMVFR